MQKIKLNKEPCLSAKREAYSYQRDAVNAIKDLEYAAIFHEQGLGKTKIAIDLMLYWLQEKKIDTVLYVTKKGLVSNWINELKSHTFMKPKILDQNSRNNYFVYNSPSRVVLTHYEVLMSERENIKLFLQARNIAIIIDEAAKIKNPYSKLTQTYFELAPFFKIRVIMTGTPVANRPYDIWAQIFFLDNGKALGTSFEDFKKNTDLENNLFEDRDKKEAFERTTASIFDKIKSFCVRETKNGGIISLPNKVYHRIEADWEKYQYELYKNIQEELRAIVIKNGVPNEDNASDTLKRLLRLVQVASNPKLVDESYCSTPGKLIVLTNLVEIIRDKKEKCIIWTNFIENVDFLAKYFKNYGAVKIHGRLSISERNRSVKAFLENQDTSILVATPASAKEGLTLTVANHAIFYDRGFSLDDYLQAQDRIHRISQQKTCHIYKIIMSDSIDEWIDILLESKHLAAQLAQGDISLDYYKDHISYEFGSIIKEILNIGGDECGG